MTITRTLGKNTLGGGSRMKVNMKTYNRSTHNLSNAWRSTMGVGTLVPCLKMLGLPGDTFDIDIESLIFTNPTIGPLFGQYKLQIDVFTCPMRLYIAQLHNNAIGVAQNMEAVKFPQYIMQSENYMNPTKENLYPQIHQSSILAYLGKRGNPYRVASTTEDVKSNAIPLLAYWDIFANYYCNKQENKYYCIGVTPASKKAVLQNSLTYDTNNLISGGTIKILWGSTEKTENGYNGIISTKNGFRISTESEQWKDNFRIIRQELNPLSTTYEYVKGNTIIQGNKTDPFTEIETKLITYKPRLQEWNIETLNDIREDLLKQGKLQKIYKNTQGGAGANPIEWIIGREVIEDNKRKQRAAYPLAGLALKTYQNDIFTNFVNSERITAITNKTKVSTEGNSFSIDALNISQKIYNYQNRLAASNGTYKDWIEVGYTQNYGLRTETPLYEGGMSDTIIFESVVNTAQSEGNPLGTIGGRGRLLNNKKGGKLHINVDEPSYIIAIASITPYVDYCEGNDWDDRLDNMGQLHVPELDGIGYEDLKTQQIAYWAAPSKAFAKTTAWQNYMTSYNKNYGEFCYNGSMSHMVLNRYVHTGEYNDSQANLSTYINPEAYNYTFADTTLVSQNYQVQIGFDIKARRKMSARIIPRI